MVEIGKEYAGDFGGCCPRRVIVLALEGEIVTFQTRDMLKHEMNVNEFIAISYRV